MTSVSVSGTMTAAPSPCSARAAIRVSTVDAAPASSDAVMNTVKPMQNILRRPKRSPRAAPVNSVQAKARL